MAATDGPSWLSYVTLDLIVYSAKRTIFQPFFAWMLPLSLRAITVPYSHPSFQLTSLYAMILTLIWFMESLNRRFAFGSPRKIDLAEEVVVITGGSGGLGKVLADFYRMKGTIVVVLDVHGKQADDGIEFYQCDVSNPEEVRSVYKTVTEEVIKANSY
jgi:hypothetical protein